MEMERPDEEEMKWWKSKSQNLQVLFQLKDHKPDHPDKKDDHQNDKPGRESAAMNLLVDFLGYHGLFFLLLFIGYNGTGGHLVSFGGLVNCNVNRSGIYSRLGFYGFGQGIIKSHD